jgi:5-methylcytosine-specific restriction endonuclease McrA
MNKAKNKCECGALKVKKSLACKSCSSKNRSGEKSPYWKGGMVARLAHNRMRAQKMKQLKDHSQEEWQELKQTYGHMCLCCKRTEPDIKLQKDHIVPISKGGADNIENIQPLCGSCNSQKYTSIIDYRSQLILKS